MASRRGVASPGKMRGFGGCVRDAGTDVDAGLSGETLAAAVAKCIEWSATENDDDP